MLLKTINSEPYNFYRAPQPTELLNICQSSVDWAEKTDAPSFITLKCFEFHSNKTELINHNFTQLIVKSCVLSQIIASLQ